MKNRKKKLRELREKKAQGIRSLKWAILWIITMLAIVAFVGYKNGWFGKKHYDINKELEKIEAPADDTSDTTANVPTATDEFKDSIR